MKKAFTGFLFLSGLLLIQPLSAGPVSREDRADIKTIGTIVVDGGNLQEFRMGINIVKTSVLVKSWEKDELAVLQTGNRFLGGIHPVNVDQSRSGDKLVLTLTRDHSFGMGIRIGRIDMTIFVPREWDGRLELHDLNMETRVEGLHTGVLSGSMKLAGLTIADSDFRFVDFDMGGDAKFRAENVRSDSWHIRGALGSIYAKDIRGTVNAETLDGNISIDYADFQGSSRLVSKMGKVSVFLPADSELELSLSSRLESVRTDFPVTGLVAESNEHQIIGTIGSSGHRLTAHSVFEKVLVYSKEN